jgi:hypothetical protein
MMAFKHDHAVSTHYKEVLDGLEWKTTIVVKTSLDLDPEAPEHDPIELSSLFDAIVKYIKENNYIDQAHIDQVESNPTKGGKFSTTPLPF